MEEISRQKTVESVSETINDHTGIVTSDFPPIPETIKSVEERTRLTVTRKLARRLVFTEFGLSPVTTSPPLAKELHFPANQRSPFSVITRRSKETRRDRRQCHCKNSKCLKLYCECFASGGYCHGCSCTDCHNILENENSRRTAVESALGRNPNAFRPKIANSSCSSQDGDDKEKAPIMGKNKKGCQCKKTGCLKRYCECFRANIMCCENCKCVDCKNLEGCEQKVAHFCGGYGNNKGSIEQINAAAFIAIGSPSYNFLEESKKRKFQKVLDIDKKDEKIHNIMQYQQANSVRISGLFPFFSVDPACHIETSTALGVSKFSCRSLLADAIHPLDARGVCSLLVVVSEAAKILAEMGEAKENQKTSDPAGNDEKNREKKPDIKKVVPENNLSENQIDILNVNATRAYGSDLQERIPNSPQCELVYDVEDKLFFVAAPQKQNLNEGFIADFHAQQERVALTCFRDCLAKLLTFGKIKTAALSMAELKSNSHRDLTDRMATLSP